MVGTTCTRSQNQHHFCFVIHSVQTTKTYFLSSMKKRHAKQKKNMISFDAQNQIEIFQIESPHKFWYKKCSDFKENERLAQLESRIEKYAADSIEWHENKPIEHGSEVAAFHSGWNKWIRGKIGKLLPNKPGSKTEIFVWAIDYGCKLTLPLDNVYLLEDRSLAFAAPINVHIGGLSGISPAFWVS